DRAWRTVTVASVPPVSRGAPARLRHCLRPARPDPAPQWTIPADLAGECRLAEYRPHDCDLARGAFEAFLAVEPVRVRTLPRGRERPARFGGRGALGGHEMVVHRYILRSVDGGCS